MRTLSTPRGRRRAAAFRLVLTAVLLAPLPVAFGHGGTFRGPNGGVPPELREPHDPEPPPPPPSGDPAPEPPSSGGSDTESPVTPPEHGPDTGGPTQPPVPPTPPGGGRGRSNTKPLGYDSWRFWWAYNNDEILNLRRVNRGTVTAVRTIFGKGDLENRSDAMRATRFEIEKGVIPALLACINRKDEHEDVHGGAIIAAAKVGSAKLIPLLEDVLRNRFRNGRDERIDFGPQARESAVLAFGLIPDLEDGARAQVRRILLEAVADGTLRTRERTWAAVALGLRRDRDAARPLLELLPLRYPDDNVQAGIVVGLGLIGDASVRPALEEILLTGALGGRELPPRVKPFAAYALGKLGDPAALPAVLKVLGSRRSGMLERRSAALAAGPLGEKASAPEEAVDALLRTVRNASDATTRNFALVSLGRIGTEKALVALLEEAENGPQGSRAFAALGLATHVWYATSLDPALRRRIVTKLADISDRLRDSETRSAFLLCRGLVKDKGALDTLVEVAAKPGDTTLRGFACVGLGLLDDPRPAVKGALRTALDERTNIDLRRDAATGLGLLRDADTVPYLLEQLRTASSFVVQGQVVTAIGAIGDRRALAPLVSLLEDRSQPPQVRALAAVGLGLIGDARPVPELARLSRDYNYRASVPDLDELLYIF
jgi:HEAT repeat protein